MFASIYDALQLDYYTAAAAARLLLLPTARGGQWMVKYRLIETLLFGFDMTSAKLHALTYVNFTCNGTDNSVVEHYRYA